MVDFRTPYNLKDFSDAEVFEPGTSETEEGQEVNIKKVYERCMRGDVSVLYLPPDAFDIKEDMDVEDAFATLNPTKSEGFDLADITAISNDLAQKLSNGKEIDGRSEEQLNYKASDERDLKSNSEASIAEQKPNLNG